ncbi:MAG: NADAR family protein, partial [Bacteroidales bacterium]|nr:NADAR family protein [Bacteroidales bacterium]
FRSVEHLYLLGEWSHEDQIDIQKDILTATSGYAAKRYKKSKYKKFIREDYPTFRHQWMLWCIWQKRLGNKDFREHLLSFRDDEVIVEVVKGDPIWAAYPDQKGILRGGNAVGKILTICRRCLKQGTQPIIDTDLLNRADIYILGERVEFRADSESLSA